jgi:hypothetical protein
MRHRAIRLTLKMINSDCTYDLMKMNFDWYLRVMAIEFLKIGCLNSEKLAVEVRQKGIVHHARHVIGVRSEK